jgi:ketosteroid isomerase-like protein
MSVTSMLPAGSVGFSCRKRIAIALLGFVTFLGPTIPPAAAQDSARLTLAKMRDDWVQDLRNKQLEPMLKFYAPDAVFLQPNGDRLSGDATLRSFFQMIMSTFNSDLTLHSQNLDVSGDLAYDSGSFEESLTTIATGARISSKGSYIIIYKRRANGNWQIVQHVWTGTPPAGT